ncbi:MAG TPA: hypothetical protein VGX25_09630 [Actinophytocola sp.]|uniref:hypothetical protein n=1 Tax=Actinophytocola sp. TaxID=1872138 RepID=UPI002DDD1562|nr:hypothetical protein [Actinophytocola sp.]HEV2779647.1 hypothetical protein [Actinophytocola sp.]
MATASPARRPGSLRAELASTRFPLDELLARQRTCLTDLPPDYIVVNESGDQYDPL